MSKNKILVQCEKANHICDKTQYKEASLWEKIKLNIHLLYCRACRKYTSNNQKLTNVIKSSNVDCLKEKERENFKKQLLKQLEKQD